MSPRASCTSTQWHSLKSEFEEQFKELQKDIAREYHVRTVGKSKGKSNIKTILKRKSNKIHNLDTDCANENIFKNSNNNEECLSIIPVESNTENVYNIKNNENLSQSSFRRRMSQP